MTSYRLKGTSGALINQAFRLSGRLLIGRADDCDVRIDLEGVAPRHAEVRTTGQGAVMLRDLGSATGTRLNGELVSEAPLHSGDEIQVGQCRLMLQAPGLKPQRVLTAEATRPPRKAWPWLLPLALVMAGVLAWQQDWLAAWLELIQP